MGTYGRSRRDRDTSFIRKLGVAILLGGVIVFALWFTVLWIGTGK